MDPHAASAGRGFVNASRRLSVAAALLALALLSIGGAWLISAYIEQEHQRDLLQWESRMGLVADARADAIGRLILAERRNLEELAANASLRFYLWQIAHAAAAPAGREAGETGALGYLRNLLLAAAERLGYDSLPASRLPASIAPLRIAGLAVFDAERRPVIATPGLHELQATYGALVGRALQHAGSPVMVLMRDAQDQAVMVMAVVVGAVPGTLAVDGRPLGVLLGIRSAEADLFPLLTRGPSFAEENESLLLELRGSDVVLLSPARDGSSGMRRTLPAAQNALAEVAAVTSPGHFVVLDNYRGRRVLQVSRTVRGQDWVLVQQVDAAEAMSLADDRRRFLLAALSLLLFSIVAVAVAAWRHGSSVRASQQAAELAAKAAKLQRQTDLLHTITDNLDVLILLVGRDGRVLFLNRAAATAAGSTIAALLDTTLAGFLPAGLQSETGEGMQAAREHGAIEHRLLQWQTAAGPRSYHASFIPVERIGEEQQPVLLVLSDVTAIEQVHRRNTDFLRRLVLTLVSAVDRHDPYSADHARRMTEVVDALARELGFGEQERSTLDLAATLANIGKIMIPVEVLTSKDPLGAADQELLHKHVEYGLDLLRDLQFEGPVLDIIAQKQERLDGRGYPRGLSGDRITLAGQVLAVANAFVALRSSRAWRNGLGVREAVDELMRGAGTQFDRRVLAALLHVTENRQDWS